MLPAKCLVHPPAGAAQRKADVMTAFGTALDVLFADPNIGHDAVYTPEGGAAACPQPCSTDGRDRRASQRAGYLGQPQR